MTAASQTTDIPTTTASSVTATSHATGRRRHPPTTPTPRPKPHLHQKPAATPAETPPATPPSTRSGHPTPTGPEDDDQHQQESQPSAPTTAQRPPAPGPTHTRKGHAGTTRRATRPSSRTAQTAWNGVPASEGKGHPDGTARHTQRGPCGAGRGKRERHNTRYGPEPPEPSASAAHTRTGHSTRQGSSGALRHAQTPRLGSLRASPRGSDWRQASSTGPAAPAPQATTH